VLAAQPVLPEAAQPLARGRGQQQREQEPPAGAAPQPLEPPTQLVQLVLPQLVQAAERQRPEEQLACAALPWRQRLSRPYPLSPSLPRPLQLALVPGWWRVPLLPHRRVSNWSASSFPLRRNRAEGQ